MFLPNSTMAFVIEGSDIVIPEITDPAYIYNIGDLIHYSDVFAEEDGEVTIFEVKDVKHEILDSYLNTIQTIVVYLTVFK